MGDAVAGPSGHGRVSSTQHEPPHKKQRVGGMRLPGTAVDQGAEGNEDANAGMQGGPRGGELVKPSTDIFSKVRFYRKVHRFLTFGIGYNNITDSTDSTIIYLTTPLAYVPWDFLFMYINPSEFSLLPVGSSVKKVRCKIRPRNVRVAFGTNASDNNLATLNQNKDLLIAHGLNKEVDARNVRYTAFQTTPTDQPMNPTALRDWQVADYQTLSDEMYGTSANVGTVVPRHQVGYPQVLQNYMSLRNANADLNPQDGWDCLQCYTNNFDADSAAGNIIAEYEYYPKVGICTVPPTMAIRKIKPATRTINRGSHVLSAQTTSVTLTNPGAGVGPVNVTATSDTTSATDRVFTALTNTFQLLEKSQNFAQGLFSRDIPQVQPSLNIGVAPVPALSTDALTGSLTNGQFQDTQAYWEVICEAEINTSFPTFRPLTTSNNVKEGDFWEHYTTQYNYANHLFDGLYVN